MSLLNHTNICKYRHFVIVCSHFGNNFNLLLLYFVSRHSWWFSFVTKQWWIYIDKFGTHRPSRSNFIHFYVVLRKCGRIICCGPLALFLPLGLAPPSGKSWIRHCKILKSLKLHVTFSFVFFPLSDRSEYIDLNQLTRPSRVSQFRFKVFSSLINFPLMAHLHLRRRTRGRTWNQIPNPMGTLYYYHAKQFTLHRLGLGSLLRISVQDRNPSWSPNPSPSLSNINEPLARNICLMSDLYR